MAISVYDEQYMNDEQKRQLQAFTDEWNRANAAGDQAAMDSAHAAAERLRAQAGNYSGLSDGSKFAGLGGAFSGVSGSYGAGTSVPSYTPYSAGVGSYTPSQLPSYEAQTGAVNSLYDAQREAALAALKSAYDNNSATLAEQQAQIPGIYQTQRNNTAAQSEVAGRNFNEYAAAAGLNTGTGGQAALARSNQLQSGLSALNQQEAEANRQVEAQIAQLKIQYQNSIAQAIADGEYQRAAALLQEYQRAAESRVTVAQAQADENYRGWQSQLAGAQFAADENYRAWQSQASAAQAAQDAEYNAWQRQLEEAQLYANYGDYSKLNNMGVNTSAYEAQMAAAAAGKASGSSRSSGSSGSSKASASGGIPALGTESWYDYIISASGATGQSVEDYLRANKSALGLTESNIKTYADRIASYRTERGQTPVQTITDSMQLGTVARSLWGQFTAYPGRQSTRLQAVQDAYSKGQITWAEADYLRRLLGA